MEKYKRWADVPEHLKSKTYCNKNRLSLKNIKPCAMVYQYINRTWVDLYDIRNLDPKPSLTPKQLKGILQANKTREDLYTCKLCKTFSTRTVSKETHLCKECFKLHKDSLYHTNIAIHALNRRLSWTNPETRDKFVILDIESTGLNYDDEVVEIAIVDTSGNTLYNQLIKPSKPIPSEVVELHGITNEMVYNAPNISEVAEELDIILKDKTILAFNSSFDQRILEYSLSKYNIIRSYKWDCVMYNQMEILETDRYISLINSVGDTFIQEHRAKSDCMLIYHLITDYEWINSELQRKEKEKKQIENLLCL
jgi:DNA polymerase-3 subunit epsilon